ncbi:MAG: hypothetical protein F6J98_20550 [Moorea sp. SIO4G2]|nr:hypothetical protein [Moorena sp. SIO4G2]
MTLLSYPGLWPRYANGARESHAHGDNSRARLCLGIPIPATGGEVQSA